MLGLIRSKTAIFQLICIFHLLRYRAQILGLVGRPRRRLVLLPHLQRPALPTGYVVPSILIVLFELVDVLVGDVFELLAVLFRYASKPLVFLDRKHGDLLSDRFELGVILVHPRGIVPLEILHNRWNIIKSNWFFVLTTSYSGSHGCLVRGAQVKLGAVHLRESDSWANLFVKPGIV